MIQTHYDRLNVAIYDSTTELAVAAANDLTAILSRVLAENAETAVIFATGNSQLAFLRELRIRPAIDWTRVRIFHMDEYLGMDARHTASFRRYLLENLVDHVRPREFSGMAGDTADLAGELQRYTELLATYPPVACVMGIGENGHLAFNDPPADFTTRAAIHVVNLDEACRRQQVNEGHFPDMSAVPTQAISLTIHALLAPPHVLVIAPEARKAVAVRAALEGPITPDCPASILRHAPHARLYLDRDSASLLTQVTPVEW